MNAILTIFSCINNLYIQSQKSQLRKKEIEGLDTNIVDINNLYLSSAKKKKKYAV